MCKDDFMKYLDFLRGLFPKANIPTNREILSIWYKPFLNTPFIIAKDMATMYFQEEQNSFNYSRLLQYKSRAMAGRMYFTEDKKESCRYCGNTGFIQFWKYDKRSKSDIMICRRCICEAGESLSSCIKQASSYDIEQYKISQNKPIDNDTNYNDKINKYLSSIEDRFSNITNIEN